MRMAVPGGDGLAAAGDGGTGYLSSQRRPLADPLGLQEVLLGEVSRGPRSFGDLAAGTIASPVARAHLLHLLWRRRLSIDLARPLADTTLVHPADGVLR